MHLVILWKENVNLQLSIIDLKDRAEDSFFEESWINKFKLKIKEINPNNIQDLMFYLEDLDKTKKAFKNSLIDFKNETNDILSRYDNYICSDDEKSITYFIQTNDRQYKLKLEEVFCIDNESMDNRDLAIQNSEQWINKKLVNYDIEIRNNNNNVLYTANEDTEINSHNKEIIKLYQNLENDFKNLKQYNEQTISFLEYMKKREIIPEILSRTEGTDSFMKEPTEKAVAAFSTILVEKNMLKLNSIGQYKIKTKLK